MPRAQHLPFFGNLGATCRSCGTTAQLVLALGILWTTVGVSADEPASTMTDDDGVTMVLVPAGPFVMGSDAQTFAEAPAHKRELPAYYIDQTEVTVEQYARFVRATGHTPPPQWIAGEPADEDLRRPIANISWFDAMSYAIWAGKRLPTEAEWEKAARGTDGRAYPWGDVDEQERRHIPPRHSSSKGHGVSLVGQYPAGRSPFGCLDMGGNVREWTACWFKPYDGADARSVHFGEQYKVIRGGAWTGTYGIPNTPSCTLRARLAPYGAHDAVGFRCVKDLDPANAPYAPQQLLEQTRARYDLALRKPRPLAFEADYQRLLTQKRVPIRVTGDEPQHGHVRAGFPLPAGLITDADTLALIDDQDQPVPVQRQVLATWPDGSAQWVLLDFNADAGDIFDVTWDPDLPRSTERRSPVITQASQDRVIIDTGAIVARLTRDELIEAITGPDGNTWLGPMAIEVTTTAHTQTHALHATGANRLTVEQNGPELAEARLQGYLTDTEGALSPFRYDLRVQAAKDARRLRLLLTLAHFADRIPDKEADQPWGTPDPVIPVLSYAVSFASPAGARTLQIGTDQDQPCSVKAETQVELAQPDPLHYELRRATGAPEQGTRAPGWIAVQGPEAWACLGVRHFWQNHPKTIFANANRIGVGLYESLTPFPWEGGLAKSHEIILAFPEASPAEVHLDPLRTAMPPAWACGTEAAGALLPRGTESLTLMPYWELWREADMQGWIRSMVTGFRNFGDAYFGGPHKGKNSFQNLEYDVHYNLLMHYLRTGQPWALDIAETLARHQVDIDFNDFSGQIFKHSPLHTTIQADLGHVFVRGLLLHYLLTGETRSLEMATKAGDWIARRVYNGLEGRFGETERPGNQVGNERKIGWSLYALSALYDVTDEERFLTAAEALCHRLISQQSPTGKLNIEWDNRIAFFNGIAMNGMLSVQEQNHDPQLTQGVLRIARRTLGCYPEYACRTLNAFCWAMHQTHDGIYLDAMERVWLSSMEFLRRFSCTTSETHAWKFPLFAARYQLFPLFAEPPAHRPDPATWRGIRLEGTDAQVYLRPVAGGTANLFVIREGLATGRVELQDFHGQAVRTFALDANDRMFEASAFALPPDAGLYRLCLTSDEAHAWQIQYDANTQVTLIDPELKYAAQLYPRAFGDVDSEASEVAIRFEAEGEGFHTATLYNAKGHPVASVRHFIDLGDHNRYEVELKAPVTGGRTGWSLEIHDLKCIGVNGLRPYWSDDPEQLFDPLKTLSADQTQLSSTRK